MKELNNKIKPETAISGKPGNKKPNKNMSLGKILIKHNPIDPFADWSRKAFKKLGILDVFDDFIYWNVGRANFIKLFRTFWKYPITGKANFPEYGGALVIANHQSELDPFLVGSAVHRKVHWLSKAENFEIPIFKSVIKPFGTIPLKRGQKDEKALEYVRSILEGGGCVGMFPEGTRSSDGILGEFHSGAARLILETSVPYVPCAIFGAYKVFPKHCSPSEIKFKGGYEITVTIGKPVYADPELELTYENIQLVKEAMHNDILLLQQGKMNESRVIKPIKEELRNQPISSEIKNLSQNQKSSIPMDPGFDPAEDLSIS